VHLGGQDDVSRSACFHSERPVYSSLVPEEYTLAVSKKLTPASRAVLMVCSANASSLVHGRS
jgi:hypothetical protein